MKHIILDTDPGVDDALAILLAFNSPEISVKAVTTVAGNVIIEAGAKIIDSNIRGPVIIGKNTIIENCYIGPFTSIYDDCIIKNSEVEFSIVLNQCQIIDVGIRIESSLLGNDVQIVSASGKPRTYKFMIGDQSRVEVV